MELAIRLATIGLLDLSLSFVAEVVAFLAMVLILARWVYPPVIRVAEARQRSVSEQLRLAEEARTAAEERLQEAVAKLNAAQSQAAEIVEAAGRSAEALRVELRQRSEEEAHRVVEAARDDIEAERRRAIDSVRTEMADLVVSATEKVIGQSLDLGHHRRLIDAAIAEVAQGADQR